MPSTSAKQARTMRAAAHDPEFAHKLGIPQRVARDFVVADQAKAEKQKGKRRKRQAQRPKGGMRD